MSGSLIIGGLLALVLRDWVFIVIGVFVSLWYFYALRWVDKYHDWQ
jgi:hypothetical protein